VAVNVTTVPGAKSADALLQLLPHEMPAGELLTAPAPMPAFVTVRVCMSGSNVAVTFRALLIVT
jgi:hypothetical protein